MKLSAILAPMIAAGVPGDVILATVKAFEDEQIDALGKRRESDAKRQAEKRKRDNSHVMSRDVTVTVPSHASAARVEDNLPRKKVAGKEGKQKKTREEDLADFVSRLSDLLDIDRVNALVDVRRAKGGKLNGHSADLLIGKIRTCGLTPSEAADTMALRNWISIEPDWLNRRGGAQAHAPPAKRTMNDSLDDIINGGTKASGYAGPTIDTGFERTDRGSLEGVVQFDAFAARQRS